MSPLKKFLNILAIIFGGLLAFSSFRGFKEAFYDVLHPDAAHSVAYSVGRMTGAAVISFCFGWIFWKGITAFKTQNATDFSDTEEDDVEEDEIV